MVSNQLNAGMQDKNGSKNFQQPGEFDKDEADETLSNARASKSLGLRVTTRHQPTAQAGTGTATGQQACGSQTTCRTEQVHRYSESLVHNHLVEIH